MKNDLELSNSCLTDYKYLLENYSEMLSNDYNENINFDNLSLYKYCDENVQIVKKYREYDKTQRYVIMDNKYIASDIFIYNNDFYRTDHVLKPMDIIKIKKVTVVFESNKKFDRFVIAAFQLVSSPGMFLANFKLLPTVTDFFVSIDDIKFNNNCDYDTCFNNIFNSKKRIFNNEASLPICKIQKINTDEIYHNSQIFFVLKCICKCLREDEFINCDKLCHYPYHFVFSDTNNDEIDAFLKFDQSGIDFYKSIKVGEDYFISNPEIINSSIDICSTNASVMLIFTDFTTVINVPADADGFTHVVKNIKFEDIFDLKKTQVIDFTARVVSGYKFDNFGSRSFDKNFYSENYYMILYLQSIETNSFADVTDGETNVSKWLQLKIKYNQFDFVEELDYFPYCQFTNIKVVCDLDIKDRNKYKHVLYFQPNSSINFIEKDDVHSFLSDNYGLENEKVNTKNFLKNKNEKNLRGVDDLYCFAENENSNEIIELKDDFEESHDKNIDEIVKNKIDENNSEIISAGIKGNENIFALQGKHKCNLNNLTDFEKLEIEKELKKNEKDVIQTSDKLERKKTNIHDSELGERNCNNINIIENNANKHKVVLKSLGNKRNRDKDKK